MLRWAVVTGWWVLVTQWAFGPGLIDRGFRLTGGVCDYLEEGGAGKVKGEIREILTGAACKLAGGQWKGGQDISGHVFLLTLGSAFLALEIFPVVLRYKGRIVMDREGALKKAEVIAAPAEIGEVIEGEREVTNAVGAAVVVGTLSWWMLLMTAAYFHTWLEKVCSSPPSLSCFSIETEADLGGGVTVHGPSGRFHRGGSCLFSPEGMACSL